MIRGGEVVAESTSGELRVPVQSPNAFAAPYRVEVSAARAPGHPPVPWIVTNPIYVLAAPIPPAIETPVSLTTAATVDDRGSIEKDASSVARLTQDGRVWTLQYALGSGERAGQYVALSLPVPPTLADVKALRFNVHASSPSRMSVQLRFKTAPDARWTRSVYVAPQSGETTVLLTDLKPVDKASALPPLALATSLLFVVDLTNAQPGQKGTLQISDVIFGR
jgi:hypothetical protein